MVYSCPMTDKTVYLTRKGYDKFQQLPKNVQDLAELALADLETEGTHPSGWNVRKINDEEYCLEITPRYGIRYKAPKR